MLYILNYWIPPLLWMAFIFPLTNDALSAQSTSHTIIPIIKPIILWLLPNASQAFIETIHILIRKYFHFLEYALLALLWARAFRGKNKRWQWKWILYAGAISIVYGALDEFLQTMITTRTGLLSDWIINSAGVAFTIISISLKNLTFPYFGKSSS